MLFIVTEPDDFDAPAPDNIDMEAPVILDDKPALNNAFPPVADPWPARNVAVPPTPDPWLVSPAAKIERPPWYVAAVPTDTSIAPA